MKNHKEWVWILVESFVMSWVKINWGWFKITQIVTYHEINNFFDIMNYMWFLLFIGDEFKFG